MNHSKISRPTSMVVAACLTMALLPALVSAQASVPNRDVQMAEAVMAAPAPSRAGAGVLAWRADGTVVALRESQNDLICLADNPAADGWSVACYHSSLEPYMARGRALREAGMENAQERLQVRWDEADAGKLAMPDKPAMLYILAGDGFDASSGQVSNPFLRWVIYTPWATAESTGVPTQPTGPGAPWLMYPGLAGAHIMITPPPPGGSN